MYVYITILILIKYQKLLSEITTLRNVARNQRHGSIATNAEVERLLTSLSTKGIASQVARLENSTSTLPTVLFSITFQRKNLGRDSYCYMLKSSALLKNLSYP